MQFIIGIDPGRSGGISLFPPGGNPKAWKMPATPRDLWDHFDMVLSVSGGARNCMGMLEFVHSMPRDGSKQAYTFGRWVGYVEMALSGRGIPYDTVRPQEWMGSLNCNTKGDKNVTKRKAQELFPALSITHATADALLIGYYARKLFLRNEL